MTACHKEVGTCACVTHYMWDGAIGADRGEFQRQTAMGRVLKCCNS